MIRIPPIVIHVPEEGQEPFVTAFLRGEPIVLRFFVSSIEKTGRTVLVMTGAPEQERKEGAK